jgi:phage-related protein
MDQNRTFVKQAMKKTSANLTELNDLLKIMSHGTAQSRANMIDNINKLKTYLDSNISFISEMDSKLEKISNEFDKELIGDLQKLNAISMDDLDEKYSDAINEIDDELFTFRTVFENINDMVADIDSTLKDAMSNLKAGHENLKNISKLDNSIDLIKDNADFVLKR